MTYIPRSPSGQRGAASPIPRIVKKRRTFRIFGFLGSALLILSVLASAAVFFYENISENQFEQARQDLAAAADRVSDREARMREIKQYDDRLKAAATLLDNHVAPSRLFEALEMNTKETVQFQSFEYTYDPGFDALLTLGGSTDEFISVVLQKLQLASADSPFEVALVSNVTKAAASSDGAQGQALSGENAVTFSVTGLLRENRLSYTGAGDETPEVQQQPTSTPDDLPAETPPENPQSDNQEGI